MPRILFFRIAFISWLMFVTFSSLFSFSGMVRAPRFNLPHADKVVHFIFYFVLVFLGVLATRDIYKANTDLKNKLLYVFLFAFFYGILIEFLQHNFTVDRQGDVLDVLANTLGAIAGIFTVKLYLKQRSSLK